MLKLKNQTNFYQGKVRNVYTLKNSIVVLEASNRISAFDVILPREIPFKGAVLNGIATHFLNATKDICNNWLDKVIAPHVSIGKLCSQIPIEVVVRGYLCGHGWREYKSGKRILCGVELPEGLKENDKLPSPIITPATKATEGHDEDISAKEILNRKIVTEQQWNLISNTALKLFARGTEMAAQQGLILADTKYEFGWLNNTLYLIDEVHTPDSSRYFYSKNYEENQKNGIKQKQLSKEFVREWLIENNFSGKEGQVVPEMSDAIVNEIQEKYIYLYETILGKKFEKEIVDNETIEKAINDYTS